MSLYRNHCFSAGAIPALCLLLTACGAPNHVERLVVLSNGEVVGHVIANSDNRSVNIDYAVDNNGRGPKIKERLVLDSRGYPLEWKITGSSLFGADVDESIFYERSRHR